VTPQRDGGAGRPLRIDDDDADDAYADVYGDAGEGDSGWGDEAEPGSEVGLTPAHALEDFLDGDDPMDTGAGGTLSPTGLTPPPPIAPQPL
jgi:hypothetical protein